VLIGLRHTYAVAKEKLFPTRAAPDDKREPHERFTSLASKVLNVTKADIDQREREWNQQKAKRKHR
jgi:hypothetical protein